MVQSLPLEGAKLGWRIQVSPGRIMLAVSRVVTQLSCGVNVVPFMTSAHCAPRGLTPHVTLLLAAEVSDCAWQVVDGAKLSTGQSHQYCVRANGGPMRITLVWHDLPSDIAAEKNLVNDLDLSVRAAGLQVCTGPASYGCTVVLWALLSCQ
jgi:hypothetical protein